MHQNEPKYEILLKFKAELWKDQRKLEHVTIGNDDVLIKHYHSIDEANQEFELLSYLHSELKLARIPEPLFCTRNTITSPYVYGVRLFNLFVELDRLQGPNLVKGRRIKKHLIERCKYRQQEIQKSLVRYFRNINLPAYSFHDKTYAIIVMLCASLGIRFNESEIHHELIQLDRIWKKYATIPFRDSTTKNMVLNCRELWLGNFSSEDERLRFINDSISNSTDMPKWVESDIIDFDFSSCVELSSVVDDPISLEFHERTWITPPSYKAISWIDNVDPISAALTFLVRYYRFGGRKAAYRMLHPWGHRIRFRHDNDNFYFDRLSRIIDFYWPDAPEFAPCLLKLNNVISRALTGKRPSIDYFIAYRLAEKRKYYVDMFPE